MCILLDLKMGEEGPFFFILNAGKGMETDLHFIADTVYVQVDERRSFYKEFTGEAGDHKDMLQLRM